MEVIQQSSVSSVDDNIFSGMTSNVEEARKAVTLFDANIQKHTEEKLHQLAEQIKAIPAHLRGQATLIIRYNFLSDNIGYLMSGLVDIVCKPVVEQTKRLATAFSNFNYAVGQTLGAYYALYDCCSSLIPNLTNEEEAKEAQKIILEYVEEQVPDISKQGKELQDSINDLYTSIINLSSNTNTNGLKTQVKNAWDDVARINTRLESISEKLSVAAAEISYMQKNQNNLTELEQYYKFRKELAQKRVKEQEAKLAEAQAKEKNEFSNKAGEILFFSWSTTKQEKIDTSWTQERAYQRIREANLSVEEFTQKISNLHKNRENAMETSKASFEHFTKLKKEEENNLTNAMAFAEKLQSDLNTQLLSAAGVSRENALRINTIFKIAQPMSKYMSNTLGGVTGMFAGIKKLALSTGRLSMRSTLIIGNNLCKLSLLGEYMSSGTFYLAQDPNFLSYHNQAQHTLGRISKTLVTQIISDPVIVEEVRSLASHKDDEINPNFI